MQPNVKPDGDDPVTIDQAAAYLSNVETEAPPLETLADAAAQAAPAEPRFPVTLPDGEPVELTLAELAAGYLRGQDYEQQTAELTEQRRELALRRQRLRELMAHAEALRPEHVAQVLPPLTLPDPMLAQADPAAYGRQRVAIDAELARREQLMQVVAQAAAQREAQLKAAQQAFEADQRTRLVAAWPELDGADSTAELMRWRDALSKHYRLSADEIDLMTDHRLRLMARDAVRWRQAEADMQAAAPARRPAPRTAAPAGRDEMAGAAAMLGRIGKTGSRERDMRLAAQYLLS